MAEVLHCGDVVGLDDSESFIRLARGATPQGHRSQPTILPTCRFTAGAPILFFCRFLLTHLVEPNEVLKCWATQLAPGGLLMLEETEAIRTTKPVFVRYLQHVETTLASQSNRLYAGHLLRALDPPLGFTALLNELRTVEVRTSDAARVFVLNLQAWKDHALGRANYSRESLLELEIELHKTAEGKSPALEIIWEMRQIALCHEAS